jgi:hypothetical protein
VKSLLIVGQPRGFTSESHRIAAKASKLDPTTISAGEVLNRDRNSNVKFPHLSRSDESYAAFSAILAQYKDGYCIKDVIQPYAVSRYLQEHPADYNVLLIERPNQQARLFQGLRGWDYPELDLRKIYPGRMALQYESIIYDCAPFFSALESLGYTVDRFPYHLDPEFIAIRELTLAKTEMAEVILTRMPEDSVFILVDEEQCGTDEVVFGRRRIPFLEKDGRYWGPADNSETAVRECERLRQSGASFIVFVWPVFWWLDYYKGFHDYLRSNFRCLLHNERLVIFDLRK